MKFGKEVVFIQGMNVKKVWTPNSDLLAQVGQNPFQAKSAYVRPSKVICVIKFKFSLRNNV